MNGESSPAPVGALVPSNGPTLPPAGPPQAGEEPRISQGMALMHASQSGQGLTPEGPPPAPMPQPASQLPPAHQGFTPQGPVAVPVSQALIPVSAAPPPSPMMMGVTPAGQIVPVQPVDP